MCSLANPNGWFYYKSWIANKHVTCTQNLTSNLTFILFFLNICQSKCWWILIFFDGFPSYSQINEVVRIFQWNLLKRFVIVNIIKEHNVIEWKQLYLQWYVTQTNTLNTHFDHKLKSGKLTVFESGTTFVILEFQGATRPLF